MELECFCPFNAEAAKNCRRATEMFFPDNVAEGPCLVPHRACRPAWIARISQESQGDLEPQGLHFCCYLLDLAVSGPFKSFPARGRDYVGVFSGPGLQNRVSETPFYALGFVAPPQGHPLPFPSALNRARANHCVFPKRP